MNYPILYSQTETDFENNGIGILSDCILCDVSEEANGAYELTMKYPSDGIHCDEIKERSILKVKIDKYRNPQLFRISQIRKDMSKNINVFAQHISYDLSGIPVSPFVSNSVISAMNAFKNNAVVDCPFSFWTDKTDSGDFSVKVPSSIRHLLGNEEDGILSIYGGEYEFDNYSVKLHSSRGVDRGVSIKYGKNLVDYRQDANCMNVATGIYPYWSIETDVGDVLIELPEKIVNAEGKYNFTKIIPVDFTSDFEYQPTHEQLRDAAKKYIKENEIGKPVVSLTVSFAQLYQSEEYKNIETLERVGLFDTVVVVFDDMAVNASAKVAKILHDTLHEKIKSVTIGSAVSNIADSFLSQKNEIQKKPDKSFVVSAVESLTKTILGASGGSVRLLDTNEDGEPDTLYIADNPNPEQAVKVWRFNYEGWGASENGYNGPFKIGATLQGGIVADFITAGVLRGILVQAGAIKSADEKIFIDLSSGSSAVFNSGISSNGLVVRADEIGAGSALSVGTTDAPDGRTKLVSISGKNELGEEFLSLRESVDPEVIKTGGRLVLSGANDSVADMGANSYGGFLSLVSPGGGEVHLSTGSANVFKSSISVDSIVPGEKADFSWQYIPNIGKTVLVLD